MPYRNKGARRRAAWAAFQPTDTGGDIPDGATAHFSFAQGVYWTEAAGDLTAAEVLSSTASIVPAVGYTGEDGVTMIGDALAALSPDMTAVCRGRVILSDPGSDTSSNIVLINFADTGDYNNAVSIGISVAYVHEPQELVMWMNCNAYDAVNDVTLDGTHIAIGAETETRFDFAVTLNTSGWVGSALGGAVETEAHVLALPPTAGVCDMISAFILNLRGLELALESITIYPVQADADLPTLSTPL